MASQAPGRWSIQTVIKQHFFDRDFCRIGSASTTKRPGMGRSAQGLYIVIVSPKSSFMSRDLGIYIYCLAGRLLIIIEVDR